MSSRQFSTLLKPFFQSLRPASTNASSKAPSIDVNQPPKVNRIRSKAVKDYPYSPSVHTPLQKEAKETPNPKKLGTSLINYVQKDLCTSPYHELFSKQNPDRLLPGSIITVDSYTSGQRGATSSFSGMLIAVKRRGVATSFHVRNVIGGVGVEIQYMLESPMIQKITVIKRAERVPRTNKDRSLVRAPGKSKLYYMRQGPEKLLQTQKILEAIADAEKEKNKKGRK